jgi:decaprenyl-phosphate phosphoribosyltransferase
MPTATPDPHHYVPARGLRSSATHRPSAADVDHRLREEHARTRGGVRAWIRAARIRQWTKNLLVFAAPAAARGTGTSPVARSVLLTYAVFCLLATGCYLANDVHDADEDRRHPVKRHRPVASGALAPRRAVIAAAISVALGLMLATAVNWDTLSVALAYVLLNAAYTLRLRGVVFVELIAISAAFVLRAIAGATAGGLAPSQPFIATVACGALFVVVGKRYADLVDPSARRSRAVLTRYSRAALRLMMTLACAVALAMYDAWAFTSSASSLTLARELSTIPLMAALLRYRVIANRGDGGAPEQVLFADRELQLLGLIWLLLFATRT